MARFCIFLGGMDLNLSFAKGLDACRKVPNIFSPNGGEPNADEYHGREKKITN